MSDKRIEKLMEAIQLQITALGRMDKKVVPFEIAYALIESAFWVMEEHKDRDQYLDDVFHECAYWNSRGKNKKNSENIVPIDSLKH